MKAPVAALKVLALFTLISVSSFEAANAACGEFIDRGGYTVLRNGCSRNLTIRWRDQGACRSGCAARVSGGSEQTVTSPQGSYSIVSED